VSRQELETTGRTAAEVVVVGSGAGGSAAARELARAGLDVLLLEAGPVHDPKTFTQREEEMIPRLFQDGGGRRTVDRTMAVLQGLGVGGSTVHNLNLCKRVPPELLDRWADQWGLESLPSALEEHYAVVERDLGVVRIPDGQVNRLNSLFESGCEALGLEHARLHHNRSGCVGSGFCELGCAYDAKLNASRVFIPQAREAGARLVADARVTRVRHRGRRVTGVEGWLGDPAAGAGPVRFRVEARAVVLAASATTSPALVLASGLGDRHGRVGRGLHLHPGTSIAAVFDRPVEAWRGVPQSVECTEFLHPVDPDRRVWIVPAFAHPAAAAGMFPGIGPELVEMLQQYRYLAAASPMLHDHGSGRIDATRSGRPRIHYQLDPADARALAHGMAETARIWLAAGARRVVVPGRQPLLLSSLAEAEALREYPVMPLDPPLLSVHPMGGLAMASDSRRGPCDVHGRYRDAKGLYVADTSLFPSSTGVPPQVTTYALGRHVGRSVTQALGGTPV
jgi:choline dehydrogenase-like flavoprotein